MSKIKQNYITMERYMNLPVIEGTENEKAIDISKLRTDSGLITLDKGLKILVLHKVLLLF